MRARARCLTKDENVTDLLYQLHSDWKQMDAIVVEVREPIEQG